jgi:hypothetical protein
MTELSDKVERSLARFERITENIDARQSGRAAGGARDASAASRERKRTMQRYGRALLRATVAFLLVMAGMFVLGVFKPLGIMGFVGAVVLAMLAFVVVGIMSGGAKEPALDPAKAVPADLANGAMVDRFDSFLYQSRRMLPAPAQGVVDQLAQQMGTLKQTLERVDPLDPTAQDARRLMSVHLPGLIDRYRHVPAAYRGEADAEGKTVDVRLTESLDAGRAALSDIAERLARQDLDAFQTQGRFIQSRYGEGEIGSGSSPAP